MRGLLIIIFNCTILLTTQARLIENFAENKGESDATELLATVRVTRQAFYDDTGSSREDVVSLDDYPRGIHRKSRYTIKSEVKEHGLKSFNASVGAKRKAKDSKKKIDTQVDKTETARPLVKKPIPKFKDLENDDDFQAIVSRLPVKVAESGENEDEDFNLDDYDFDVNHDEFSSRGKPSEPRRPKEKTKVVEKTKAAKLETFKPISEQPEEEKIHSKVLIPLVPQTNVKRDIVTKKAADKLKEDYYDDYVTTTTVSETKRETDDDLTEETDNSKEYMKRNPVRAVRSPWTSILTHNREDKTAPKNPNNTTFLTLFISTQNKQDEKKS